MITAGVARRYSCGAMAQDPEGAAGDDGPARVALRRRLLRAAAGCASIALGASMLAYVARDRALWLALVTYVPLGVVALAMVVAHVIAFERRRWKRRVAAILVALLAGGVWVAEMRGEGSAFPDGPPAGAMRVVQWNVQWGRDDAGWAATVAAIRQSAADVVVLSEAPSNAKLNDLCAQLGDGWSFRARRNERGERYWFAIAVVSRWPMLPERAVKLPNGAGMHVRIDAPTGPIRVLAVDGVSDPFVPRTPMLEAAAATAAATGADIIAGDFNAPARAVGFDRFDAHGFDLASRAADGWRGTYPAKLPMYDIDHIWVGNRFHPAGCIMLKSPGTNHRGQVAHLVPSS